MPRAIRSLAELAHPGVAGAGADRGRLTLFFGAAPGVGKTHAMLAAASARRGEGVDVLVGWIEAHSRVDTVALAELIVRLSMTFELVIDTV